MAQRTVGRGSSAAVAYRLTLSVFLTYVSVGMLNDVPPRSVAFEVL